MNVEQGRRSDRPRDDRARAATARSLACIVLAEGPGASIMPARYLEGVTVRRARPHLAVADQSGPEHGQAGRGRVREATGQEAARDRRAARLRVALLPCPTRSTSSSAASSASAPIGPWSRTTSTACWSRFPGQLNLNYVPFDELIDPETLVTVVRLIQPGSDFQRLARFLENYPHD